MAGSSAARILWTSFSCREHFVQTGRYARDTLQMRVTQPLVIVHPHGAIAIAVLDQQFDRARAFCRVSNRILETIGGICRAIDCHDLSANRETVVVSQSFPNHFAS